MKFDFVLCFVAACLNASPVAAEKVVTAIVSVYLFFSLFSFVFFITFFHLQQQDHLVRINSKNNTNNNNNTYDCESFTRCSLFLQIFLFTTHSIIA